MCIQKRMKFSTEKDLKLALDDDDDDNGEDETKVKKYYWKSL